MVSRIVPALVASLALLLASSAVDASPGKHERVDVKPMKKGSDVVGIQIKLTIVPDSRGYNTVLIGLGKPGTHGRDYTKGSDPKGGYLVHQFPAETVDKTPKEVTLKVLYADMPNLKPGESFEISTAFQTNGRTAHLWGMSNEKYTAPGAAAARTTKVSNVKRAGRVQQLKQRTRARTSSRPARSARTAKATPRRTPTKSRR